MYATGMFIIAMYFFAIPNQRNLLIVCISCKKFLPSSFIAVFYIYDDSYIQIIGKYYYITFVSITSDTISQICLFGRFFYRFEAFFQLPRLTHLFSSSGWNGKHCTLEGCPKACNGHGQCKTNHNLEWECWCESGWFGTGCDMPLEQDCSDRRDNDQGKKRGGFISRCWLITVVLSMY